MNKVVFWLCLSLVAATPSFAVGPTLPAIPKYSSFEVRGIVISVASVGISGGSCPSGYAEETVKIFVNSDVGSVAVVFPEGETLPSTLDCVLVSGMLIPPCHGDDQPIAIVSNMAEDGTCE